MIIIKCNQKDELKVIEEYESKGYILRGRQHHIDGFSLIFGPPYDYVIGDKPNNNGEWTFDKEEWLKKEVRPERDKKLKETDYLMLYDIRIKLSSTKLEDIIKYRQDLRDLPDTLKSVTKPEVEYPIKPAISTTIKG